MTTSIMSNYEEISNSNKVENTVYLSKLSIISSMSVTLGYMIYMLLFAGFWASVGFFFHAQTLIITALAAGAAAGLLGGIINVSIAAIIRRRKRIKGDPTLQEEQVAKRAKVKETIAKCNKAIWKIIWIVLSAPFKAVGRIFKRQLKVVVLENPPTENVVEVPIEKCGPLAPEGCVQSQKFYNAFDEARKEAANAEA